MSGCQTASPHVSQLETLSDRCAYGLRPHDLILTRTTMRHVLLSAGLLLGPAVAGAQQSAPAALSLADAIALARDHNPAYRQALNDRGPAAWGVRNAYTSLLIPR